MIMYIYIYIYIYFFCCYYKSMHYQRVCEVLSESIQATLFEHHTQKILRRFHTHYLIFANILSCSKIFFKNKHPSFMIKMK